MTPRPFALLLPVALALAACGGEPAAAPPTIIGPVPTAASSTAPAASATTVLSVPGMT